MKWTPGMEGCQEGHKSGRWWNCQELEGDLTGMIYAWGYGDKMPLTEAYLEVFSQTLEGKELGRMEGK